MPQWQRSQWFLYPPWKLSCLYLNSPCWLDVAAQQGARRGGKSPPPSSPETPDRNWWPQPSGTKPTLQPPWNLCRSMSAVLIASRRTLGTYQLRTATSFNGTVLTWGKTQMFRQESVIFMVLWKTPRNYDFDEYTSRVSSQVSDKSSTKEFPSFKGSVETKIHLQVMN